MNTNEFLGAMYNKVRDLKMYSASAEFERGVSEAAAIVSSMGEKYIQLEQKIEALKEFEREKAQLETEILLLTEGLKRDYGYEHREAGN